MCGRKWNLIQGEEKNRIGDRLVAAVVVPGKLNTEGNQKAEKLNKKWRKREVMSLNAYNINPGTSEQWIPSFLRNA